MVMTAGTGRQKVVNDDIQLDRGSIISNEEIHANDENDDTTIETQMEDLTGFRIDEKEMKIPKTKIISTKLSTVFEMPPSYFNGSF